MNRRGQLIVEFALGFCFLVALFFLFVKSFRLIQDRQQLLALVRLGSALQAQTSLSDEFIQSYVESAARDIAWPAGATVSVDIGRYTGVPAASFYQLRHTRAALSVPWLGERLNFSEETIRHKEVN